MRYILLFFGTVSLVAGQDTKQACTITLRVVDVEGRPLPYRVGSFVNSKGIDYSVDFEELTGRVPCDWSLYTFEVVRTDVNHNHANRVGRVRVSGSENWLTISTDPNVIVGVDRVGSASWSVPDGYVWRGRLTPVPRERTWIYIRSAVRTQYLESELEAAVDANGEFRVYGGFLKGPYVLYVMNDSGQVLHTTSVNVVSRVPVESLVINMPDENPASPVVK
jgi:hypothetical protein